MSATASGDIGDMKAIIGRVAAGATLTEAQASAAFDIIMSGNATPSQMGGFLMALRVRGETVEEIAGAARVMRAKAVPIDSPPGTIDTCGTGGDGAGTFNISTAAALVAAACGVPVAKHGNRAMSSKSGAADVLAALGVNLDCDMALVRKALWEARIGFLMAPRHHLAMRNVGPTRVELGTRTIFNLLGPLSNPAGAKRQLLGVFDAKWVEPLAHVLKRLGSESAWVVHGSDGLDEITTTGPSTVAQLRDGEVTVFEVTPEEAGIFRAHPEHLKGGDAHTNAEAIRALFDGAHGAYRDIVVLNAAAALVVAGTARDLKDGAEAARHALDGGGARTVLRALVDISNEGTPA
ncbi:anthranilate phosphoribosyltransferase [Azospirillum sp. RWY-5-1]|uniref:Anthranilate phosphoribosyltransferase n=1 Tax=Azospirillum oleiclasticum TaxID=2735135 RepID=A0ABX2TKD2_9PROT|nr:anthranilate phosphoribosyltransferase [Azospirillum oleiclasticum]NYZ16963.1 anthranilate phosphoribosyltransferase [Azospirillum oleiclasticum]NYZ24594.1 anthranilate phosphoribosyltransferase [Azospirillum oleiclasticum]